MNTNVKEHHKQVFKYSSKYSNTNYSSIQAVIIHRNQFQFEPDYPYKPMYVPLLPEISDYKPMGALRARTVNLLGASRKNGYIMESFAQKQ